MRGIGSEGLLSGEVEGEGEGEGGGGGVSHVFQTHSTN